ncbi:TIGR02302 family protein [Mongoliimonas terrestris]|uniref:TIGR02302 family protein n=1 Tax=Mongoliimonas terrestris TaxID=1709001 RepID=UPI000A683E76|nr:TIGR02302 family protein [Mongoliimonas terrestris]
MADPLHTEPTRPTADTDPLAALANKTRLARGSLIWERIWPRLVPVLALLAVFASAAWLGVFAALGPYVRLALVAVFVVALLAALVHLARVRLPGRPEALGRLERDSGFSHHPLATLADTRATGRDDAVSDALWRAHRRRVAASLSAVEVRAPSPRMDRRDPYALRAAVFLLFVIGLVAARHDPWSPLASAFSLPAPPPSNVRMDAWVTPPGYTGRAPIYLTTAQAEGAAPLASEGNPLAVPEGSVVAVRVNGVEAPTARFVPAGSEEGVAIEGAAAPAAANARTDEGIVRPTAFEHTLDGSGTVDLGAADETLRRFHFQVTPDLPPTIRQVEDPAATAKGAFRLAYEVTDDYRVAGARALFETPRTALTPNFGQTTEAARPLVPAPEMPLGLPRRGAETPVAETFRDLSAHPWAGATVSMRLEARDDAGKLGLSQPMDVVVPARPFRNPIARMLVEQRRILALDANTQPFVTDVIGTVIARGEGMLDGAGMQVGFAVLHSRLENASTDDELRAALDLMWEMALAIDGGDASLAEQRLREAREALRDALQNDASPEEIARLTEELRKAMDEYLQALQEQMRNDPSLSQEMSPQQQQNAQEVSPEDFQEMIDRIEELSKLGDKEAAEQLLSQLDRMLENLQTAQPRQNQRNQQQGQQGPMNQMMNELADMIRRQQELMNETFNTSPDGQQQNQDGQPMTPEERAEAMQRLQEGQSELQKRLEQMLGQMQQQGMQPGEQLGEAGKSMGEAQQSLGQGESESALGQQGQALDQMRQGAQQLAEQMGDQEGEGQGRGRGQSEFAEDPLGRPQRREGPDFGDSVKVPGEIEVQRARRILEELRRRFSEPTRPTIELDYLQRLLNPF